MHYADIISALHKAGHTPTQCAKKLRVTPGAVSRVIHGDISSYNIASYISSVTNIPLNRLWPDGRYSVPPKRYRQNQKAA